MHRRCLLTFDLIQGKFKTFLMRASACWHVCEDGVLGKSIQMLRCQACSFTKKTNPVRFSTLADFLVNYSYTMFLSVDYKLKINFNNPLPVWIFNLCWRWNEWLFYADSAQLGVRGGGIHEAWDYVKHPRQWICEIKMPINVRRIPQICWSFVIDSNVTARSFKTESSRPSQSTN